MPLPKEVTDALKRIADGMAGSQERMTALETSVSDLVRSVDGQRVAQEGIVTRIDELERNPRVDVPGLEDPKERKKFSFARLVLAMRERDWSLAPYEKEVKDQVDRAVIGGKDSAGGFLIPNQFIPDFVELLRTNTVLMQAGATVLDDLVGSPIDIPKQTGGSTANWVSEIGTIPDSADPTFGDVKLVPHKLAGLAKISNSLLNRANLRSVESIVRADLAAAMSEKMDLAGLRGGASVNEPVGLINVSGINSVAFGTNGAVPTLALLQQFPNALEDANALKGTKLGWIMNPKVRQYIEINVKDGNNRPIFLPADAAVNLRPKGSIFGYPVNVTTQLPTDLDKGSSTDILAEIFFANWAEFLIGMWGGMRIDATGDTTGAFTGDQTWIRTIQEVDFGVRHEVSFAYCADSKYA